MHLEDTFFLLLPRQSQNLALTKKSNRTFSDRLLAPRRRKDVCAFIHYRAGFLINRKFSIHLSDAPLRAHPGGQSALIQGGCFPARPCPELAQKGWRQSMPLLGHFICHRGSVEMQHGQSRPAPSNKSKHGPSGNTAFIYHMISIRFYQEIKKKKKNSQQILIKREK